LKRNIVPPPVYLLLFCGFAWLIDAHLIIGEWVVEQPSFMYTTRKLVCGALLVTGLGLDIRSIVQFLAARTSFNPLNVNNNRVLVTTGFYRYTRNPMYLGLITLLLAWVVYLGNYIGLILIPFLMWVLTRLQITPEEQALARIFGAQYLNYKNRVRRWL